jgi:hypothetical protein
MQPSRHRIRRPADRRQIVRLNNRKPLLRRQPLADNRFVKDARYH